MATETGTTDRPTAAEVEHREAIADAAASLAGHQVTDPAGREILRRVSAEEISADEAIEEIKDHLGITVG